ncbi:tRNA pseudouridine(55) synthase TruB [Tenuifilum osseticum]|uniref:tRNA pseudouridine(55) synthase TruB n=1 Tax=Tenuifilum osseticum TaxID=3374723 RepID=UPI0034E45D29
MEVNRFESIKEGTILLIDKPYDWTSFDVVGKLRSLIKKYTGEKSTKIGHAGTLDPLATGLLVICTGKATKRVMELTADNKEYIAKIKLGETTPSFDLETDVDAVYPFDHVTRELVEATLKNFTGWQLQEPPAFSAKYVNGKRAYEYARKGIDPKLEPVPIEIHSIELIGFDLPFLTIKIACSKGTYIRGLARDIGKALSTGAHLVELRRTRSGIFSIEQALSIAEVEKKLSDLGNQS